MTREEFFGSDDQRAVLRRGRGMAELLGDDARYSYYGRAVGLTAPDDGSVDQLAALARVQGNANYSAVPLRETDKIKSELEARGLTPMHYAKWEGADAALAAARHVAETFQLPEDLTLIQLDATTPQAHLASLAEMALSCGVLPLCGELLRGLFKPAICLIAMDQNSKVVSCAASSAFAHPDHATYGGQAWWGMLATDPARRGQRLALILGAHAMLAMEAQFGLRDFMTGVEPGNAPSEAVCTRMGLVAGEFTFISCADPKTLTSGRMTK